MNEIRVNPNVLGETGGALGAVAGPVDSARHGLDSLGSAGRAAGDGPASASFTRMQVALVAAVDRAGLLVSLLGGRVTRGCRRLPLRRPGGAAGPSQDGWWSVIRADPVAGPVAIPAGDPDELRAAASTLSASAEALESAAATAEGMVGAAIPTAWSGGAARSCGSAQERAVGDCRALVRAIREAATVVAQLAAEQPAPHGNLQQGSDPEGGRLMDWRPRMNWYRISKYDPTFRNEEGRYLRDEWTSVSDIGRSFGGVTLDVSTYLATETAYVRSVQEFMNDAGVASLRVASLEPPSDLDDLRQLGLPDAGELAPLAHELRDGMDLADRKLDQALRLNLREVLWCELVRPRRLSVDVGHDYYLHIGTAAPSERAIAKTHQLGQFVHDAPDLAAEAE